MTHPDEERLVLFHYAEQTPAERRRIEGHLAGCASCRGGYEALRRVLAAVDAAPVPERGDLYGAEVWYRLRPRLPERRTPRLNAISAMFGRGTFVRMPPSALAAGALALVVAAFLAGRFGPGRPAGDAAPAAVPMRATAPQVRERVLLVAVGDHLERSQMVLVELVNAEGNGAIDISAEQQWAEDLVGENRLYRQTAARSGEAGMASVLEDLERVLLEIAHGPSTVSAVELETLRRRIEAQGILFKVRVIGSQVQQREKVAGQALLRTTS